MATDHRGGNVQNEIIKEEHDGINNAKRVTLAIPADQDPLPVSSPTLITNIDTTTTTNVVYIGEAIPGSTEADSAWKITRIDKSTAPTTVRYAGLDFSETFTGLAGKTYA